MLRKYCCCNVFKGFKTDPFSNLSFLLPKRKTAAILFLEGKKKEKRTEKRKGSKEILEILKNSLSPENFIAMNSIFDKKRHKNFVKNFPIQFVQETKKLT